MGRMQAIEMAAMDNLDMDIKLRWHLTSNHYPPIPSSMVEPCKQAIQAVNEGESGRQIKLPEGVLYKGERNTAPAGAIVDAHHLDPFIEVEEYYID